MTSRRQAQCRGERWRAPVTQALLLLAVLAMAGCGAIGADRVTRDRFDYTAGLAPAGPQVPPLKPPPPKLNYAKPSPNSHSETSMPPHRTVAARAGQGTAS